MADLRVPIRQQGSGLPTLGFISIPVEAEPEGAATGSPITKLRIGKAIHALGGGDKPYDWATVGNDNKLVPPAKMGTGAPGNTVFLRGDGVWAAPPSGGMGSATWLGLTDTPASWGDEGQYPAINAAQDALEWATPLATYLDRDGAPPTPPGAAGTIGTDNAGKVYPTITDHVTHTVPSTWTTVDLAFNQPNRFWRGVDPDATTRTTNDGYFYYDTPHNSFVQRRNNLWQQTHWGYAWQYITGVDATIDFRQSIYLGEFRTEALARAAMDANATAQVRYMDGATPDANMRAYWLDTRRDTLVEVSTYTATSTTHENHLTWGDPLVDQADVHNLIDALVTPLTAENLDAIIETPGPFGLSHAVSTINDPHTLNLGLAPDTIARLVAEGGTTGYVYTKTDTGHDWAPAPATGDDAYDWATVGDTSLVPTAKLGTGTADNTTFLRGDGTWATVPAAGDDAFDWATVGNTDLVPTAKLGTGTADATTFLRGDGTWAVVSTSGGATTLLGLTDTPNDYGHAGQYLHLNAAADALVWTTIPETESWARVGVADLVPPAKLGTGTPSSANYLRGDGSWQPVMGGTGGPSNVVFPDDLGNLRDGTADDWDQDDNFSKVVGWDGEEWNRIQRTVVPRSGTFTSVVNGDILGLNLRYRGEATSDPSSGNQTGDVYYNFNGFFRVYDGTAYVTRDIDSAELSNAEIVSTTDYSSQSAALAVVTADGQRVVWNGRLRTISDFVPGGVTYPWVRTERPIPWAGSFVAALSAVRSTSGSAPKVQLVRGTPNLLYLFDWNRTDAPLEAANHLPVGGFIGLRQGDELLVLRVLSEFVDESQGGHYEVETYHDNPNLSYAGIATDVLVTAPNPFVDITYQSNNRRIQATFLDATRTELDLANLPATYVVDDEEEDFLPNSLILEQGERKLWYYYGSSRTGDTCTACFPFEVSTSQFITIPYAQGRGDSSKWFRGDGSLADLPGITHEQFQDGLGANFHVNGPGLQVTYDDPGNRFTLNSRIEHWAANTYQGRIPLNKMNNNLLSGVEQFMLEHPWVPLGILASDMAVGVNTFTLTGPLPFTPHVADLYRIDDEIMGYSAISADMRTLTVSRAEMLTTEAAHAAGAQVFRLARDSFQLALQFQHPDGSTDMERIVPLPFRTQQQVHDAVWPWALATDNSVIPPTKTGAGVRDGSRYLLDTGAWSPLPPPGSYTEPWALIANPAVMVPPAKLGSGATSSSVFLRGDGTWASVATSPDLYKVANSDVAFSTAGGRRRVNLTVTGANNNAGTTLIFQYHEDPTAVSDMEIEVGVNGANYVRIKWDNPRGGGLENLRLRDIDQFSYLMLYRAGSFWHLIGGTVTEHAASWAQSGNPDTIPVAKIPALPYITQALADARYLQLTGGSLSGALHVTHATGRVLDVTGSGTAQSTAVQRLTLGLGRDKAFSIRSTGGAAVDNEWFQIDRNIDGGTTGHAGIGIGSAGVGSETTPDTILFRSAANEWTTPDKFVAGEFQVGGALATTQMNLGLEPWARAGTGDQIPAFRLSAIASWAHQINTDRIPSAKLTPDFWKIADSAVAFANETVGGNTFRRVTITEADAQDADGTMVVFRWTDTTVTPINRTVQIQLNATTARNCIYIDSNGSLRAFTLDNVLVGAYHTFYRGANDNYYLMGQSTYGTGGGSGASSFLQLTDTPTSYGTPGQSPIMNAAADGLEWGAPGFSLIQQAAGDVVVTVGSTWPTQANMGLDYTLPPDSENALLAIDPGRVSSTTGEFTNELIWVRAAEITKTAAGNYAGAIGSSRVRFEDKLPGNIDIFAGFVTVGGVDKLLLTTSNASASLYNAKVYKVVAAGSRSFNFLGLSDTPSAYGDEGQYPVVNAAEDGIEWEHPGIEFVGATYSHNSVGYFIALDGHGTGAPRSDRLVCFNFTGTVPNSVPSTAEVSVDYNGALSANRRRVRILQANGTFRNMLVSELGPSTNTFYILRATSNSWDLVARTWTPSAAADFAGQVFAWALIGNTSTIPDAKIPGLDASKTVSGAFHTDRLANAVTEARIIAEVDGTVGNNRVIGYDTQDAGLRWYTLPSGGTGVSNFIDLNDTPSSFGSAGQHVVVNAGADGLVFADAPSGGDDAFDWATVGNTDQIPVAKLGTGTADNTVFLRGDGSWQSVPSGGDDAFDWATVGNTDRIPVAKLGSGTPSASVFLRGDGTWIAPPGGGTGDDAFDWATVGNTDDIPVGKLGNVLSWARDGNTDRIPEDKMTGYPTLFTLTGDGPLSMQFLMQRQGLGNLSASGILVPGVPNDITHSFSGNVLTLNIGRQGSASTLRETIDFSGIGSGTGLTAEQVRDTTADFITPIFPLGKEHDDAGDKLYLTINQQFENVPALMVFSSVGNAVLIDRADASRSRTVGDTISNFSSAADVQYHPPSKRIYMVAVTGEIYRTAPGEIDSFSQVGSGRIPITSGDNCRGITWHEDDDQWYVGSEIGLWEVDIADPPSSTKAGDWSAFGSATALAGLTYLNGHVYTIEQAAPRRLLRVNTSTPQNSVGVGNVQNVTGGRYDFVAASGGALYATWLQSGSQSLHIVPLGNPGTPIVLGGISGLGGVALGGMTAVDIELTTELIPERGNLYFTNARWDDRLEDVVNPGGSLDASLDTIDVDGDVYAVRNLFAVNDEGDLPAPGEHQVGQGYYILQDKTLRIGVNRPHTQSSPTGTFNAISARTDLHIVTSLPTDQNALTDGHYYYLNHGSQSGFYQVAVRYGILELVQTSARSALADSKTSGGQDVEWLGAEATSTDALRFTYSVDSGTDYFFLDTSDNTIKILDQSTFNGTVGTTNHYSFEQLPTGMGTGGASTFLDLTDTPGSYGNAGQYVKLNASADALEFATIPSYSDWARTGNTSLVPTNKLGTGTADGTTVLYGDQTWGALPAAGASDFVSAESDGDLADPTASDFNDNPPFSIKLGWDGFQFYRVERSLAGGHGASASYSTVGTDTNFTVGGTTYQYKGAHQHDYNVSASVNDFYFKWSTGYWRILRARGSRVRDYWENFDVRTVIPTYIGDWDTQAQALGHITATGQYVVYILNNAYTLRRVTAFTAADAGDYEYDWAEYHAFAGDALTTDDVRAIIEQNEHTFVARQTISQSEYTGTEPVLNIIVGTSGDRKALQFHNEDNTTAWGSFEFALGSIDKPGLAMGSGDAGRDVELYRDAANVWRTPDTFHAGVFDVDDDGAASTRTNLGVPGRHTDDTIEGTGEEDDPLKVSTHNVITASQEWIKHYTDAALDYSTKGATVAHIFTTGPYTYRVTQIRVSMDAPNSGITCRARLYTLHHNSNEIDEKIADGPSRQFSTRGEFHYLHFPDGGVLVPPNTRVAVCVSRTDQSNDSAVFLRVGGEASASPQKSYNDAHMDWERHGWAEYETREPQSGDGTRTHDTDGSADAYGNMEIYYSLVIEHGHLVGDGTVGASHIDSDGATDGHALLADGSDGADWGAVARPGVSNTFTAAQTIDHDGTGLSVDASGYTGSAPAFEVIVGTSGDRKGFQIKQGSETTAWASFEHSAGGSGKPGLALGPGGSARDVSLYRDAANVWRTGSNDAFHVGELRVDTGGRLASRQQLGLGTAAVANTGTTSGTIPVLTTDGKVDQDRLIRPFRDVAYGATISWNVESSPRAEVTLTGDATLSISDDTDGGIYVMSFTQDGTGGHDVTFPSGWKWAGGTAGEVATGANDNTILTIMRVGSDVVAAPLLKEVA